MNPFRILTQEQFEQELRDAGYSKTEQLTATGTFWASETKKHVLIPFPYDGMYPEAIVRPIRLKIPVLKRNPLA